MHFPTATVSSALMMRSTWVRCDNHRSRMGSFPFHRIAEAGRPRCQNQVLRSRSPPGVRVLVSDPLETVLPKRLRYRNEWCMNNTCDLDCKILETCHWLLFSCRDLESCSPVASNKPEFENVRWSTVSSKAMLFPDFNRFEMLMMIPCLRFAMWRWTSILSRQSSPVWKCPTVDP